MHIEQSSEDGTSVSALKGNDNYRRMSYSALLKVQALCLMQLLNVCSCILETRMLAWLACQARFMFLGVHFMEKKTIICPSLKLAKLSGLVITPPSLDPLASQTVKQDFDINSSSG